ncbi:BGTF surface domain-containing protein [Halobellus sp. EA9]|uniref:DUF7827 domain-containing protein n=1 Tax=Halobellus sp. EA9 TaxID=3421647 RepID=UPI003EB7CBA5
MTGNTNAHRAVFLAVLLVLSVFAGTVAFTGSVAAIGDPTADGGEITNKTVPETSNNTHSITLNASLNTSRSAYVNYNVSFDTKFDLNGTTNTTVQASTDNVTIVGTSFDTSQNNFTVNVSTDGAGSADDDQVNLTFDLVGVKAPDVSSDTDYDVIFALDNETDGSVEGSRTLGTLTVENTPSGAPELDSAIHYVDTGDEGAGVELVFSEPVSIPQKSDVSLYDDGSTVAINTIRPAPSDSPDAARYFLNTSGTVATGDVEVKLSSDITDADDNSISDTDNQSVTVAPVTVKVNDKKNVYEGSNVAVVNSSTNVDVEIEGPNNYYFSGSTGTNSEVFVFNSTNEALGQYNVSIDGSTITNTQVNLRNLGLSVSLDSQSVTTEDTIEGTVTARASDRPLTVELLDSSGDVVDDSGATISSARLNGQGEYDFSFNVSDLDLDTGNYTVRVTDDYSGINVETETITVSESADDDANFASGTITEQRGDIAEVTVTMSSTDRATVKVGTPDQGVVSNVTVEDGNNDGQVTLYVDTWAFNQTDGGAPYTYGSDGGPIYSLDDDSDDEIVDADLTTTVDDLIDAGEYDLEVYPGDNAQGSSTDVATLILEERNTTAFRSWTSATSTSLSDLEDVNEALANNELTQASDIANGDYVVHQLVSSGLEGVLNAQHSEEVTEEFFEYKNTSGNGGIYNLTIEQADPGANQDPKMLNYTEENTTVIADGDNDTYFVVVNTQTARYYSNNNLVSDDTALEANFTVFNKDSTDFAAQGLDDDEDETRLLEYEVVEPTISVNEPYNVSSAAGQTITGTTTLAPGTELSVRIRSDDGVRPSFLKTASPVVQSDRTWNVTFDFSGQNVGDTYDITVNDGNNGADSVTEDGTVVEVVETPTTTAAPDTDTATPEPGTEAPDTETATETSAPDTQTSAPATETPTSTPGFGVVVALTALVAAALLAIRRD